MSDEMASDPSLSLSSSSPTCIHPPSSPCCNSNSLGQVPGASQDRNDVAADRARRNVGLTDADTAGAEPPPTQKHFCTPRNDPIHPRTQAHTRFSFETFVTEVEVNKYWLCVNAFWRLLPSQDNDITARAVGLGFRQFSSSIPSFIPSPVLGRFGHRGGPARCGVRFSILSAAAFSNAVVAGEGEIRIPLTSYHTRGACACEERHDGRGPRRELPGGQSGSEHASPVVDLQITLSRPLRGLAYSYCVILLLHMPINQSSSSSSVCFPPTAPWPI